MNILSFHIKRNNLVNLVSLFISNIILKEIKQIYSLQAEQGVTKTFKAVPQCYLAKSDVIVLEDLKQRGFVMVDRKKDLDFNHSCATVRYFIVSLFGFLLVF